MIRLLFWIALIALAFWLWRTFKASKSSSVRPSGNTLPMVRCAHCGVHLPSDRALANGVDWYCSTAHLKLGPASSDR